MVISLHLVRIATLTLFDVEIFLSEKSSYSLCELALLDFRYREERKRVLFGVDFFCINRVLPESWFNTCICPFQNGLFNKYFILLIPNGVVPWIWKFMFVVWNIHYVNLYKLYYLFFASWCQSILYVKLTYINQIYDITFCTLYLLIFPSICHNILYVILTHLYLVYVKTFGTLCKRVLTRCKIILVYFGNIFRSWTFCDLLSTFFSEKSLVIL